MKKKYFIQTFGCQMNAADSEKINMVLLQCGMMRAGSFDDADVVVFNTCSVRQKWEDRVFGYIREIEKLNKERRKSKSREDIKIGVTGCMVRKTGIAKRYLENSHKEVIEKRKTAKKIDYLASQEGIYNCDDKLFPRSLAIDFVLRIEETKYIPHILTEIYGYRVGQEDRFDDYLKQTQQRETPYSANIIIQTGCDNYCTFCIVPYTRWQEVSRDHSEIVGECKEAVESGAKEITLLGQNVNSYGKQSNLKLWNEEKSVWNDKRSLKIGIDLDDSLFVVLCQEVLDRYNNKYNKSLSLSDIKSFDCNHIKELNDEYEAYESEHELDMWMQKWGEEILRKWKEEGHEIYAITSRPPARESATIALLEKYFWAWFFTEIIMIKKTWEDLKYRAANRLGLDFVVDDGPHHIDNYMKYFEWTVCIFHQPWNSEMQSDQKKLFKARDWYEVDAALRRSHFHSPFRKLLTDIDQIKGIERIRFTSSNPHDMTRDILDAHFELKNTCNYLHFALQSWNNEMLKKMNRRHSYEDFKAMVEYLRSKDPLFSISTDIIVGFSGETNDMFADTVRAFTECQFDFAYNARYSVRPNTLAAKLYPDDVPDEIKAERWHILNDLLLKNIGKRNELMLGRSEQVLITWEKDEIFSGRTRNFKEVFFDKRDGYGIWDYAQIKITDLDRYVLKGQYS